MLRYKKLVGKVIRCAYTTGMHMRGVLVDLLRVSFIHTNTSMFVHAPPDKHETTTTNSWARRVFMCPSIRVGRRKRRVAGTQGHRHARRLHAPRSFLAGGWPLLDEIINFLVVVARRNTRCRWLAPKDIASENVRQRRRSEEGGSRWTEVVKTPRVC